MEKRVKRLDYLLKNLHFIVIHVPIAMLIFSFVFDVMALVFKRKEWHSAGMLCLIVGTLGAIASVITGPEETRNPLLHQHEFFAQTTMILFILLSLVRLFFLYRKSVDIGSKTAYLAAALVGVLLVSYTGHLGGQMVHKPRPANTNPSPDFNKNKPSSP